MSLHTLQIRPSEPSDVAAIAGIYDWSVRHGTGTFELDAPGEAETSRRRADVLAKGLPWPAAEREGRVVGCAHANTFRPRRAYRFCLEDSIYLAPEMQGLGAAAGADGPQ